MFSCPGYLVRDLFVFRTLRSPWHINVGYRPLTSSDRSYVEIKDSITASIQPHIRTTSIRTFKFLALNRAAKLLKTIDFVLALVRCTVHAPVVYSYLYYLLTSISGVPPVSSASVLISVLNVRRSAYQPPALSPTCI